ncbi:MAG: twin-arginine translocase TatA/TatE family subunit [Treponema sp.]|nr:twin-arginine translocase TatA/TatE family subunit [Treponema sp.]
MFGIGVQELLLILFIVLILFGAKKVPELARGLGKALNEFKKAASGLDIEDDQGSQKAGEEEKPHGPGDRAE